jgi:hypothetical protein
MNLAGPSVLTDLFCFGALKDGTIFRLVSAAAAGEISVL